MNPARLLLELQLNFSSSAWFACKQTVSPGFVYNTNPVYNEFRSSDSSLARVLSFYEVPHKMREQSTVVVSIRPINKWMTTNHLHDVG